MSPLAASILAFQNVMLGAVASTPPDIRGIEPPEVYYIAGSPWLLVVAGVCVVLAGLVAWALIFRLGKREPIKPLSARELAEQRLRELEARAGTLDPRAFGAEVAEVLRAYIGGQFGLHPERQTSSEFLASVAGSRAFTQVEHGLLANFLEGCDLLKFARADATLERKRHLLAQATDFVRSSAPPPLAAQVSSVPPALPPASLPPALPAAR